MRQTAARVRDHGSRHLTAWLVQRQSRSERTTPADFNALDAADYPSEPGAMGTVMSAARNRGSATEYR